MLAISACVVLAGLTGMLGVLLTSVQQRRRELALMRAIGASPLHLLTLVLFEALLLTIGGVLAGLAALWALLLVAREAVGDAFGLYLTLAWPDGLTLIVVAVLLAGSLAGTLPAWRAWRYTLADGLTPKT
jgi:putative ABC transport system permease protein